MNRYDIYNSDQSWFAVETVKFQGHLLRITVRRNAYDAQSFAKTERWDGERWQEVDRLPITSLPKATQEVSYVQPKEKKVTDGLFDGLSFMFKRAQEFFRAVEAA